MLKIKQCTTKQLIGQRNKSKWKLENVFTWMIVRLVSEIAGYSYSHAYRKNVALNTYIRREHCWKSFSKVKDKNQNKFKENRRKEIIKVRKDNSKLERQQ